MDKRIAIIGLGYVGLPLAVAFGKRFVTVGFDINGGRIEELRQGFDATRECSDEQLRSAEYLSYSSDLSVLAECSIYIVTVPTPIDSANRPNLEPLTAASAMIGGVLKEGDIVVYESTVYPGATEEVCVPVLERASGLVFNEDFFCGYSPERVNPGDKVNTLTKIKKVTSGSTEAVADEIDSLYSLIIDAGTWRASSIKVAEAAKVIENCQRDLNIAFVNELSLIFNRLGIDTHDVLDAASTKWNFLPFKPGMVGGHCIGVDPYYLTHKAEEVGYNPHVILAGRRINDSMARYSAQVIVQKMLKNRVDVASSVVGILGITFKENCPDIRNSKIFDLIDEFRRWNVSVRVCDPWAHRDEVYEGYGIELFDLGSIGPVDVLVVSVGHGEFRALSAEDLRILCPHERAILGDLKGLYDLGSVRSAGFDVFRL